MNKNITYKAIFINGEEKESMQFKTVGEYLQSDKTSLSFEYEGLSMNISYKGNHLWLKNNQSMLHLHIHKMIDNLYQLPYGSVELKTKVLLFEADEKHMKIKYELFDQFSLISTVYILITMSDIHDELEYC